MKILMVNKFYYIKGGSETYYFSLKKLLEKMGHTVVDFSMKDEKNEYSLYSDYFVENKDYNSSSSIVSKVKMGIDIIYSKEAKSKFKELVIQEKPDIVHLHIFQHQISPSILDVCKKYDIPTIYTAHDLKMICPNYKMMHHSKVCEECKNGHFYNCVKNKCVKDSYSKSLVNFIEGYFHKYKKTYDVIDYILTPSHFYKKKFIQFGVNSDKVIHLPNFLEQEDDSFNLNEVNKNYYLYFGRLSEEKGIITLIKAVEKLNVTLYVVGTGPLKEEIDNYIITNSINNVKMLGFKSGNELKEIVRNSKAIILPSEWYENGPYSAIESLQLSRPIIGANIGGIPELIDGNGLIFESGSVHSLKESISKFESFNSEEIEQLEKKSKEIYQLNYVGSLHYEKIIEVMKLAISKHNNKLL
ncbi:MAG: glycosyltransferase [Turicibacter sanguinis]|uniref:glycosyltransferase n=1 Tax=Turicibacter sanguinis TaxID=154288 RepID=UPI002F94E132